MTYIRRETVKECPVHLAILDKAQDHLIENGYFSKEEVLEGIGMPAMADYVRWDYIIDFLKEGIKVRVDSSGQKYVDETNAEKYEVVPLAKSFWRKRNYKKKLASTPQNRRENPEQFIALGHGKKTAGYALVDFEDGIMAVRQLAHKEAIRNGAAQAFRQYTLALLERDIPEIPDGAKREAIEAARVKLLK